MRSSPPRRPVPPSPARGLGSVARLRCLCRPFSFGASPASPVRRGRPSAPLSAFCRPFWGCGWSEAARTLSRPSVLLPRCAPGAGLASGAVPLTAGRHMGTIWAAGPRAPHRPNSSRKTLNKIRVLLRLVCSPMLTKPTLNKTVILFRFFPVGGPCAAVAGGVSPLFPLLSPPIWNVYREFTTPDRACQGSPRRWHSDERPRPPLTAPSGSSTV